MDDNTKNIEYNETSSCEYCGNLIEMCMCVCPYCGETSFSVMYFFFIGEFGT